ncbi:GNAT family N-acetyltransferase [Prosthecochloris sp. SCSIO W1101]|uniref:GNAT family N-acetyltransferase n=1 Tax=Prosthecochloris sp. SCSIO W1101 TaxID=2992242 RepID=UPI00223E504E|nr:GNAT family protein [Prosthecochloris sp. SCSIO W1101]UZJ40892.1 GNAT family N-acetyltransferase [Prosthecochloris sp. SCSIO W1101]
MFSGKYIRLRRLEGNDVDIIFSHWNNYELRQYLPSPLPSSKDDLTELVRVKDKSFRERSEFFFGIEECCTSKELIGIVNLESISWISRHAFIGSFCIFKPSLRGKGYGKDTMLTLLDFAFNVIDLHVIALMVESHNKQAIGLYEDCSFTNRGTMRELVYRNGKRCDVTMMDVLKKDFIDRYGILPKGENVF